MMSANLRAFLALIRWAEGTSDDNGYRALYGHRKDAPRLFDSFDDHPRVIAQTPWGATTAAGAYQFMASVPGKVMTNTWDRAKEALSLPDFSPESQDRAAIWLIEQRGALPAIERGDLEDALSRCSWEWASLPVGRSNAGRYGQPNRTFTACETIFELGGGTLTQAAGTPPQKSLPDAPSPPTPAAVPPAPIQESTMPLPVAASLALAAELWRILRPTPRVEAAAGAIEKAAPVLFDAARKAVPSAVNEQQMVEQIKANPQLQAQFRSAAMLRWDDLAPAWEAEEKSRREAREFAAEMTGSGPAWRQIGYGLLIAILSLVIVGGIGFVFHEVLFSDGERFSQSTRDGIIEVLKNIGILVIGFYFGSSANSRQKDQTINEQAKR